MGWIPLKIHPEHQKVLRLADLTGSSPEICLSCAVRWFRWVDENCKIAATGMSEAAFHGITRWMKRYAKNGKSLAEAMQDPFVLWLEVREGSLHVVEMERNFGSSAKRRLMAAERAADNRRNRAEDADSRAQGSAQNSHLHNNTVQNKESSNEDSPPYPKSIDTVEFRAAWSEWLSYRDEREMKPYVPRGIKAQLTRLSRWGSDRAVAAIEFSIAQQWQGIFEATSNGRVQQQPAEDPITKRIRQRREAGIDLH